MKHLIVSLPALLALLLVGGCALGPAYRYNANAGGGYYYGQSPWGHADTVITGSYSPRPWGWSGYPGWYGHTGIGFGTTYTYYPHRDAYWHDWRVRHRWRQRQRRQQRHQWRRHHRHHRQRMHVRDRADRPAYRPPPVKPLNRPAPPRRVERIQLDP